MHHSVIKTLPFNTSQRALNLVCIPAQTRHTCAHVVSMADASDAQSWYLLGRAYMTQQKYNKAYEAYQQAVYRDGRNPTFWISIGVLYFQINQYKDALDAYTRAIRLNPYISEVWFDLGSLYESCNRQLQDAVDAYLRAKELDPSNTVVVERLEILRRYEEDPSIIIPPAPAPRDVHPTAYSGPTNRNEPPPPMRTSPPGSGSFETLRGRAISRPGSSSGRYRNGSLGPPVDRSRGQGDIALADARERDRAYTQNGRDRPGTDIHHGSIHSAYLNAPSNQQPLPPVMHSQSQGPPPSSSSSHRRHVGHGSARRTSPQRSVSPGGAPGPSGYGRSSARGGSPLPPVAGLGLHGPPGASHPSSSAAGGHYTSYAPPTSRYSGLDRPRSPGSSARGGTYGGVIPPSGPPATPGGDMEWERDGRPYGHPPPEARDFIDRDRDIRDQRVRIKEEPREQRGMRNGPSLPPPTPQHINGGARHYPHDRPHDRRPSDDFEMRPPPPPQTPGHGYPPHDWEARSSSRAGARSPMPPPQRYDSGRGRYDPVQEERALPPNRYSSPPPNYSQGHHSPVVYMGHDEREMHRGRQGPPSTHHEPPQAVQLTPQDPQPPNDRRRRGRQTGTEKPDTASQSGKDGTPAPKRRGRTKKDQPTPAPTAVQPQPPSSTSGTTSSSPTGYRGPDSYDVRPQQYRYAESDRRGPAEPLGTSRPAFPPRRQPDDDYDENGAVDALMGLSGTRGTTKPSSTASQPPPPGSRPLSRRDSGAREHTPTPPGGSQVQVQRKRRRSGSIDSVYEVPPRAPAMEPVERMEPERKKPRLEDESSGPAPPQANGASGGRNYPPNIRTRMGSMDLLMRDDSKKVPSPKHSAPPSAVGTAEAAPAPAPASQKGRASSPMAVDAPRTDSPTRISPNGTPANTDGPKKSPEQDRPRASVERASSSPKNRREGSHSATTSTNGKPQSSGAPLVVHSPSATSRSGSVAASNSGAAPTAA